MDAEKKALGAWWIWVLFLMLISGVAFAVLDTAGIFTRTVVERKVFENSFQYSEARKTEIATYEAEIAGIQARLGSPTLDEATRAALQQQLMVLQTRLRIARQRSQ